MHPPFYIPDPLVRHDIVANDCKSPRRGAPQRLHIAPAPGWPPVVLNIPLLRDMESVQMPSGRLVYEPPVLQIVQPQKSGLQLAIGRFLIRMGQRMIMERRLG